jgi:hypothetical protein
MIIGGRWHVWVEDVLSHLFGFSGSFGVKK